MSEKLNTICEPTWCNGCGNYMFIHALKNAILFLGKEPKDVVMTYDIGCSGNMINNLDVCGFAALHGRSIPVAVGIKRANANLTVIAQGGDGGVLSEGTNHLIHAARRNDPITVLVNNNMVFGLTTGQATPSTPKNFKTSSTPQGNNENQLSAVDLALNSGAGFVARAFAFDKERTEEIITAAIRHDGFSLVEIIQPCIIWAKELLKEMMEKKQYVEGSLEFDDVVGKDNLYGVLYHSGGGTK
jgi:2-oxoglutarate ferredoxin oxidoreductase subunit beta